MTAEQWEEYKRRSREWNIKVSFALLHSRAYAGIGLLVQP